MILSFIVSREFWNWRCSVLTHSLTWHQAVRRTKRTPLTSGKKLFRFQRNREFSLVRLEFVNERWMHRQTTYEWIEVINWYLNECKKEAGGPRRSWPTTLCRVWIVIGPMWSIKSMKSWDVCGSRFVSKQRGHKTHMARETLLGNPKWIIKKP